MVSVRPVCWRTAGEALGDGGEFVAAADSVLTEARCEDPPDGRHKGTAAREKDAIHFARLDSSAFQQGIDTVLDGGQVFGNPALELGTRQRNAEVHRRRARYAVAEAELGGVAVRQLELHFLNGLVQLISEVAFDHGDERLDFLRFECAYARAFQNLANIVGAQKRKIVPALEVRVDPRR